MKRPTHRPPKFATDLSLNFVSIFLFGLPIPFILNHLPLGERRKRR